MKSLVAIGSAIAILSLAAGASAQATPPAEAAPADPAAAPPSSAAAPPPPITVSGGGASDAAADRPETSGPPRFDLVRINAGFRVGYMPDRGFDSFADSDTLTQFSVDGTYPLVTSGRVVLGAGLAWDYGGRSSPLRGQSTDLSVHRIGIPLEARYHLHPTVFAFGKVTPGATAVLAEIIGETKPLNATAWAFSADASLGASILMGPRQHLERRGTPRLWLTPELGYTVMTKASLAANVDRPSEEVLGSDEDANLRSLSLNGFFWRATVGLTF